MTKSLAIFMFGLLLWSALSQSVILRNPGCNSYDQQGICKSCSTRFYKDQNNICQPVNPNCRTYDEMNGDCLSCYPGFGLLEGTCLPGIEDQASLDPNCNQFNDKVCVKCSFGYFFGQDNKCTKANPDCATFNDKNGDCTSCYPSFILSEGKCIQQAAKTVDPNCNQFDANKNCIKCSSGFFFNSGLCAKIDDSCKNFDTDIKICKQCYPGYVLDLQSKCVPEAMKENPNPLCAEWNGTVCIRCSKGSIFDNKNMCFLQDAYCRTFDGPTSTCKRCYTGYALQDGVCKLEEVKSVSDPNCNSFSNGRCSKCSAGFYFNAAKVCVKIDDSCKSFSVANRRCMECYPGYQLSSSGECVVAIQSVTDVNCAQWDGSVCKKCSVGSAFDANGLCVIRDAKCRQYDDMTNKCKGCYSGYDLNEDSTKCIESAIEQVFDLNCAEWKEKVCQRCSFGAVFNSFGKCVILDQQCKDYDSISGLCNSCYSGYELNSLNICTLKSLEQVADPLCAEWSQDICVRCSPGSFFGQTGKCTQIDTSCKAANSLTGECLECYDGYSLSIDRKCLKDTEDVANIDLNCAEFEGKVCKKCSTGAAFNNFGRCVFLDPQCRQYDQSSGVCKACYIGYALDQTFTCIRSAVQDARDPLCAEWNEDICMKCSFGAFFNSLGVCSQADSSCRTFNEVTGKCSSCYNGYAVSEEGTCAKDSVKDSRDLNCAEWDISGDLCLRCASGSFFNGLGICQLVDPLCKTFSALSGECTSCYNGYGLSPLSICQKSIATQGDPLCAEFIDSKCSKCSFGAFFNKNGLCQLVDSLCSQFDKLTGQCLKCYPGHALKQGKCQIDTSYTLSDPFCAEFQNNVCKRCSTGYYFEKDGKCTAADPLCATFSQMDGKCLSCFIGYQIQSGLCVPKPEEARDPNCAVFNPDNSCNQCSKGFIFSAKLQNCQLANPLCKTTYENGACQSCYSGYVIEGQTCVLDANAESSFCAEFIQDICVRCASRTFINSIGQCEKVSEDCRTYNDFNGQCLSCYSGFALKAGKCLKDQIQGGCSQFNADNQCTKCATGFYLNQNQQCAQIDAQCANFNFKTTKCEGCYNGYTLLEGRCQLSQVKEEFEVKNCVAYNTENNCIQCFDRFYLSANQCKDVSVFCKTYDIITGQCKSCYSTFKLRNGQCSK